MSRTGLSPTKGINRSNESLTRQQNWPNSSTMTEPNRIYAVGDIHGHIDLLHNVHQMIEADRKRTQDWDAPIVHLGDLVDRGPQSAAVIDYLIAGPTRGGTWITVKGNHDNMFTLFMDDPKIQDPQLRKELTWLNPRLGGMTTLASYGIETAETRSPADLQKDAIARVPDQHVAFLKALPLTYQAAGAVCVHAGIRPEVPLDQQDPSDLIWIREPFLAYTKSHGPLIVHGHTPIDAATHYGNRLNLDSGAAYGGPLSVAVIEDRKVFLLTPDGRRPLSPELE